MKNHLPYFCRNEATRTPDPYVPNVVRYQLRYIPIGLIKNLFFKTGCKNSKITGVVPIFLIKQETNSR